MSSEYSVHNKHFVCERMKGHFVLACRLAASAPGTGVAGSRGKSMKEHYEAGGHVK